LKTTHLAPKVTSCERLDGLLETHSWEETSWQATLGSARKLFKSLSQKIQNELEAEKWDKQLRLLEENSSTRDTMWSALEAISAIEVWPKSSQEAVQEWKAKKVASTEQESWLGKTVTAVRTVEKVRQTTQHMAREHGEVSFPMQMGDSTFHFYGSFQETKDLPAQIADFRILHSMRSMIQDTFQVVANDLGNVFCLTACWAPKKQGSEASVEGVRDNLLGLDCFGPEVLKALAKMFASC